MNPKIHDSWKEILMQEFRADYFLQLKEFLMTEKKTYTVYPPGNKIFSAFDYTPFENVKVVIIGQDPYHGPGQAHGLCFSVPEGIKKPPSLVNIFKELYNDIGIGIPTHGNLEKWAKQGVLLLNATLTVRANTAGSHQRKGWEQFTDSIIRRTSDLKKNLVFILWGRYAHEKELLIDTSKHYILKAAHPSPFSAYNGFFGCKHFSKTNEYLTQNGLSEIDWRV
ncbi:MAG: uracil-DNA glycosylase [Bacteroidota bacterium]